METVHHMITSADGDFSVPAPAVADVDSAELSRLVIPFEDNLRLKAVVDRVNADPELFALWHVANINAVKRLGMSDHGPVHVQLIANIALKLLRTIMAYGGVPNIVSDYDMTSDDAEVIVVLAALLHDVGMSIHRNDHEHFSLFIASDKLKSLLEGIYPAFQGTVVRSETLHAIIGHRSKGKPLTLEAGVVRVADALDMAKGRSRIPFEAGQINIHSLSAAAVEQVSIEPGETKPIRIEIVMSNSAGIFQVDELLKDKLRGSGIEQYVEVEAHVEGETEKRLLQVFRF
ncbi:MAG: HD domain-containing protein [Anaerolineae bacterium]